MNFRKILTVLLVMFLIAGSMPVYADVPEASVIVNEELLLSTATNSDAKLRGDSLMNKKTITSAELDVLDEYASIQIDEIDDVYSMITVAMDEPEVVYTYSDGRTVEEFSKVAYVVNSTSTGNVSENFNNSIVYMTLRIYYRRLVAEGFSYYDIVTGYAEITNLDSSCFATRLVLEVREGGLYYIDSDSQGQESVGLRTTTINNPSLDVEYSCSSPYSEYFLPGTGVFFGSLTATCHYTRGTGSYSRSYMLQPWDI